MGERWLHLPRRGGGARGRVSEATPAGAGARERAAALAEQVRDVALALGVDRVGFADSRALDASEPAGHRPSDLLSSSRSVIVLARALTGGSLEELREKGVPSSDELMAETFIVLGELNRVTVELARRVERMTGQTARTCTEHHVGGWNLRRTTPAEFLLTRVALRLLPRIGLATWLRAHLEPQLRFDLSFRGAAVAAGLGAIGRCGLLLTPEYGPRVLLTAVLSAYPFPPDSPAADPCTDCLACARACPVGAVSTDPRATGEARYDRLRCLRMNLSLGDTHLSGHKCSACLAACPIGPRSSVADDEAPA